MHGKFNRSFGCQLLPPILQLPRKSFLPTVDGPTATAAPVQPSPSAARAIQRTGTAAGGGAVASISISPHHPHVHHVGSGHGHHQHLQHQTLQQQSPEDVKKTIMKTSSGVNLRGVSHRNRSNSSSSNSAAAAAARARQIAAAANAVSTSNAASSHLSQSLASTSSLAAHMQQQMHGGSGDAKLSFSDSLKMQTTRLENPTHYHIMQNTATDSPTTPGGASSPSNPSSDMDELDSTPNSGTKIKSSAGSGGDMRFGRSSKPDSEMTEEEFAGMSKDRQKKDNHNQIERKRRYHINDKIKELGTLLPTAVGPNSKGKILQASVDYISELRRDRTEKQMLEERLHSVEEENKALLSKVQELERLQHLSPSALLLSSSPNAAGNSSLASSLTSRITLTQPPVSQHQQQQFSSGSVGSISPLTTGGIGPIRHAQRLQSQNSGGGGGAAALAPNVAQLLRSSPIPPMPMSGGGSGNSNTPSPSAAALAGGSHRQQWSPLAHNSSGQQLSPATSGGFMFLHHQQQQQQQQQHSPFTHRSVKEIVKEEPLQFAVAASSGSHQSARNIITAARSNFGGTTSTSFSGSGATLNHTPPMTIELGGGSSSNIATASGGGGGAGASSIDSGVHSNNNNNNNFLLYGTSAPPGDIYYPVLRHHQQQQMQQQSHMQQQQQQQHQQASYQNSYGSLSSPLNFNLQQQNNINNNMSNDMQGDNSNNTNAMLDDALNSMQIDAANIEELLDSANPSDFLGAFGSSTDPDSYFSSAGGNAASSGNAGGQQGSNYSPLTALMMGEHDIMDTENYP